MSLNCDLSALLHCHFDSQTMHGNFMVFFSPYPLEHTAVRKIDMSEKVFEVDIITWDAWLHAYVVPKRRIAELLIFIRKLRYYNSLKTVAIKTNLIM